ncbi:type VI secretion system TssO [Pareuzebyella sediminis]|uniref:type VI secretion system TssO n=1 Tax=Pareuzebyella sediminis TaxID=2607998 RepID=UPI0011ECEB32|nr:type VI secretion system TssO [Pareuzebyella sediminis]
MKPKNSKERRIAFLKFLGMFIVTVFTILAATFFKYKVPEKENTLLREEANMFKMGKKFQSHFFNEMKSAKGLIDSMDIEGQNVSYQNSLISAKIVDLQNMIPTKEMSDTYDMYMDVVQLYVELQMAKDKLYDLKDAEQTIAEYKVALEGCREDLKEVRRELAIERR